MYFLYFIYLYIFVFYIIYFNMFSYLLYTLYIFIFYTFTRSTLHIGCLCACGVGGCWAWGVKIKKGNIWLKTL